MLMETFLFIPMACDIVRDMHHHFGTRIYCLINPPSLLMAMWNIVSTDIIKWVNPWNFKVTPVNMLFVLYVT